MSELLIIIWKYGLHFNCNNHENVKCETQIQQKEKWYIFYNKNNEIGDSDDSQLKWEKLR